MAQTFTLRMKPATREALERQAQEQGIPKTALAERYIEEGIRMRSHPGIVFRDGPAGRRAALVAGPDVWEVIMVFLDEARRVKATADNLRVPVGLIGEAVGYYADYREEIDSWLEVNRRMAEETEASWRRRQDVIST